MKVFQSQLIRYRRLAGYESAKDFAKACNIPYQNYMNYENKGSEPKYDVLCKIAQKLCVTIDELLGNTSDNEYSLLIASLARLKIETTLKKDIAYIKVDGNDIAIPYKILSEINDRFCQIYDKNIGDALEIIERSTKTIMTSIVIAFGNLDIASTYLQKCLNDELSIGDEYYYFDTPLSLRFLKSILTNKQRTDPKEYAQLLLYLQNVMKKSLLEKAVE